MPSDDSDNRSAPGPRPTVLIVDDQPDVAETGADMLTFLGYQAKTANTATQALELLDGGVPIDVLFLDIGMRSGMSGLELALIVRERFPGMAVLLTTGHGDAMAEAQERGFALLPKPYSIATLREAMARLPKR